MNPQTMIVDNEQKRERAIKVVSLVPLDKPLKVTIEPFIARRTNTQNARLWALHTKAAEHVGVSSADMHEEMLCEHYGFTEVRLPTGRIKRVPNERSSTKDVKKFAKFMEFVETFYITNLGIWLEDM
jgi:hypothetical protein